MELRHLRSFVAVAEELHFTRAAFKVHITTPALSERIRDLEQELGVRLLDRTKRSVALTEAGARFLHEAREIVLHAERAALAAKRAGRGEVGRIAVGYVLSVACSGLLSSALATFRRRHPSVDVELSRLVAARQIEALADGVLDIGFLRPPAQYPVGICGIVLRRHAIVLALPRGHRLSRLGVVPIARLAGESLIAPSMQFGFDGHIAAIGRQGGFQPRVARRAPDFMTVLALVAAGYGIAAVPESLRCVKLAGVVYRSLADPIDPGAFAAAFRSGEQAPATRALIQLLGKIAVRKGGASSERAA